MLMGLCFSFLDRSSFLNAGTTLAVLSRSGDIPLVIDKLIIPVNVEAITGEANLITFGDNVS